VLRPVYIVFASRRIGLAIGLPTLKRDQDDSQNRDPIPRRPALRGEVAFY